MEMADVWLRPENRSRRYVLHAVDVSHEALGGLMKYLREQVPKAAEKKIPPELMAKVKAKEKAILDGSFKVAVDDNQPKPTAK